MALVIRSADTKIFNSGLSAAFDKRVIADSGTIEDINKVDDALAPIGAAGLNPSLVFIPGAKKVSKAHSIIPYSGLGDFTVVRASNTAVRKNAQGYYEPVLANFPRYDYDVATGKWSVNVEPAATNLIIDPRLFSKPSWTKSGATIEGDPTTVGAEILTNCGAAGQTDWVDSNSDGVADNVLMGVGGDLSTGSIVTGNGFTGNAQRCVENNAADRAFLRIEANIVANKRYLLQFKYRCNSALGSGTSSFIYSVPVNTGDALSYEVYFSSNSNSSYLSFYTGALSGAYIELDEVSLKEVSGFSCPFVDANGVNTLEGMKLVATANNATIKLTTPVTTTPATSYVNSLFIKRVTGTGQVYLVDINNTDRAITLTTDWQRFEYAAAAAGATGQAGVKLATSGDEVMICHQQTAVGTVATSPIYAAVQGSSETRNADAISLTGATALIGQTEGTFVVEVVLRKLSQARDLFGVTDLTNANRVGIALTSGNKVVFVTRKDPTSTVIATTAADFLEGRNKIAFAYKDGDFAYSVNGAAATVITTTGVMPIVALTEVLMGKPFYNGVYLNDKVLPTLVAKTRLSNAQLAALTTL